MVSPFIQILLASFGAACLTASPIHAQSMSRVSVDSAGMQAGSGSLDLSMSQDGRFVAFANPAPMVAGDTNGLSDVFVHDLQTGATARVSVNSAGSEANGESTSPALSADGRYVAFLSSAGNLVPGDTNGVKDIFVHDRLTGQTRRVSISSSGAEGNGPCFTLAISATGNRVAFESWATNLVPGDSNNAGDVFVHDLASGSTSRVSVDSAGAQANRESGYPTVSASGRHVAFVSYASNLVPGDSNGFGDTFVHDLLTGATMRVSVDSNGAQGNVGGLQPSISADGLRVAFVSDSSNLVPGDTNGSRDAFVHDLLTGSTSRVSVDSNGAQGDRESAYTPAISADGSFVSFVSQATNLVLGDSNGVKDVFVHDLQSGQTSRVSVAGSGDQSNGDSWGSGAGPGPGPPLSANGRYVAFLSDASNLVSSDTNANRDAFVHDRRLGPGLTRAGICPGLVTLTVNHATANGSVAFVDGPAGLYVKPAPPCQGLTLGVSPPTLRTIVTADGFGIVSLILNAPPGACGRSVQAVDVTTCAGTDVIVL